MAIGIASGSSSERSALKANEEIIEVWEKDPSVSAFTDLMNRALDKPAEHVTLAGDPDKPMIIRWMNAQRTTSLLSI